MSVSVTDPPVNPDRVVGGGSGGGEFVVTPDVIAKGGADFAWLQDHIFILTDFIQNVAQAGQGMAGDSKAGPVFAAGYDPVVAAAARAAARAAVPLGDIAIGLVNAANNYIQLENENTRLIGPGGPPEEPLFPLPDVHDQPPVIPDFPSVAGWDGFLPMLPAPLAKYWPQGNTGLLRKIANAWREGAWGLDDIGKDVGKLVATAETQQAAWVPVFVQQCARLWGEGGTGTVGQLGPAMNKIADALFDYTDRIDRARDRMLKLAPEAAALSALSATPLALFTVPKLYAVLMKAKNLTKQLAAETEQVTEPLNGLAASLDAGLSLRAVP